MSALTAGRISRLETLTAVVLLIAFWIGMLASLRGTSPTVDEGVHLSAGYTFWRYNDYRLNPENGNLPQRVMALPLLFGDYKFPATDSDIWRGTNKWELTWQWFYELGNNAGEMTRHGRAAMGLIAVALGLLVWLWSRQLFGPLGGLLSLLLYVLNPSILANGGLMTSDTASALFFLAATWCWWRMLHRFTLWRLVISALAMGGLCMSKMSAPLIIPVALILVVGRLIHRSPLPISGFGRSGNLRSRATQLLAFMAAGVVHAVIVLIVIWSFYGFRYAAFSPATPAGAWTDETWEAVLYKPSPGVFFERLGLGPTQLEDVKKIFARERGQLNGWPITSVRAVEAVKREAMTSEQAIRLNQLLAEPSPWFAARVFETMCRYHLLPEAYIYGYTHVWRGTRERAGFFHGSYSMSGWRTFFPWSFLVKTPLTVFAVMALAFAAVIAKRRAEREGLFSGLYETLPLWVLMAVYWAVAIVSHINIGHRHLLPAYPPLFILCGTGAWWLRAWLDEGKVSTKWARAAGVGLCVAITLLAAEVAYRFPHYLAYFNGIIRPANGYRHVVDSSIDWGQDLPGVRRYIETRHITGPAYLSYFGFASPVYYRVPVTNTYSFTGRCRTSPLRILSLSPEQPEKGLNDFLHRETDYDDEVAATVQQGDKMLGVVVKKQAALRFTAGTYFISATMLQAITIPARGAFGPWNERLEKSYQSARQLVAPMLSDDPAQRMSALTQFPPEKWIRAINDYEYFRFYRLAAYLRQREPDDNVGFSILVYHLSEEDLARALDGPPAELGRDVLSELFGAPRDG
jgi:hypothetical protein